ncbi:1-deoxyxylulose-5-phosphate synthase YajO-like [Glandiceps talaboti]
MQYNFLGKSGLKVSNICLGTAIFGDRKDGRPGQCDESQAHVLMDRFVECGGNFIDTADLYSNGLAEQYIGSWMTKRQTRDQMVIGTKVWGKTITSDPVNGCGLSRKHIARSIDRSLQRLQTNYIDLYQLHGWDPGAPIEETLRTLNDLVRCGKVHYFGVSNYTGWQLQKVALLCESMGLAARCVSLQQEYSLLCRASEWELFDVCRNEGIGLIPWGPLKGGWLTGKVRRGASQAPEGSRINHSETNPRFYKPTGNLAHPNFSDHANDNTWNLLERMENAAKSHGKTIAQVGLRWLLQKDIIPSVIIGTKTLEQFNENMGAASGWQLTEEQMRDLDKASAISIPQPYQYLLGHPAQKDRIRHSVCT